MLFYKNCLQGEGLEINTPRFLEINKEVLDTISEENTCIVSPYQKNRIDDFNLLYNLKHQKNLIDKIVLTQNSYSILDLTDIIGINEW